VFMTKNTMSTNKGHQSKPTESEQVVPQASHDRADFSDSQVGLSQAPTGTTPGRKPLFGR
jgi:hypothetical protein